MFSGPLYLTVTCTVFVFAFGVADYGFSGEMTPGMVSVFNTLWWIQSASVYEAFGTISHVLDRRISTQCLVRLRIHAHASDYGGWF